MAIHPVSICHLSHSFGERILYTDLSLEFEQGKIYGLLGKNGVGKTTLIKILMGFLTPNAGICRIFGEPANAISPKNRERVGLLFERHLAYNFFSLEQVERFMARFYPRWKKERYYDLVSLLGLPNTHKIAWMSEGQRSQVVLGLILAQDPELLILDDYSMGLDAGYRRLFVDYLREHLKDGQHTVILTSHVIQDMNRFVDNVVFLRRGGETHVTGLAEFCQGFHCWSLTKDALDCKRFVDKKQSLSSVVNIEEHHDRFEFFSFRAKEDLLRDLGTIGITLTASSLSEVPMDLEDAFVGFTGRR